MEEDHGDNFYEKGKELEEILKNKNLDEETKKLIELAMDFSYSTAYCVRTCDMNGSYYVAMKYSEKYQKIKKILKDGK